MLKALKNMFNKKEKRLKKLELDVMELQLQIERFENEGGNTTMRDILERNHFNKGL